MLIFLFKNNSFASTFGTPLHYSFFILKTLHMLHHKFADLHIFVTMIFYINLLIPSHEPRCGAILLIAPADRTGLVNLLVCGLLFVLFEKRKQTFKKAHFDKIDKIKGFALSLKNI